MILKPCPFCGMEADAEDEDTIYPNGVGWLDHQNGFRHYVNRKDAPPEQWCYSVHCVQHHGGCDAEMSGDSIDEAINKWNRRI